MPANLILIGRIAGAFGVRGEVRISVYGDDPMALLTYRQLKRADGSSAFTLLSGRAVKDELIVRTEPVLVKEAIDALRGLELYVPREVLPPPQEDEFYLADLIGLRADAPDGAVLGVVKAVQNFGAGDMLEIEPADAAAFYIPFSHDAVPDVRIADGVLIIVPPDDA